MTLPDFITAFPGVRLPLPESVVSTHSVRSDDGLVLFFEAHEDLDIPPHAHGAQWGVLIKGALTLVMDGVTHEIRPGQTYSIPAGCVHSAKLAAGSVAMDVFEEADRYEILR